MKLSTIIVSFVATSMAASFRGSRFVDDNMDFNSNDLSLEAIEEQIIVDDWQDVNGWQDAEWDLFFQELDGMANDYFIANEIIDDPYVFDKSAFTGPIEKR